MPLNYPPPLIDPATTPLVRVEFNAEWLQFLIGYISELEDPSLFSDDPAIRTEQLVHVESLIDIFMGATDVI